uniref:Putative secreted protein n=1 Tax=Ixodes ricinus TaxID=34613 RepID=A0A6B0UG26_IXORI
MLLVCYGSCGKDALSRTLALMLVIFCSPLLSYAEELWQSGDIAASLRSATSGVPKVYDRWRSEATPKLPLRRAQVVDFFPAVAVLQEVLLDQYRRTMPSDCVW